MKEFLPGSLIKMSGAGNTFVLVDNRQASKQPLPESLKVLSQAEVAQRICSPVTGVGADGFVFINDSEDESLSFKWDFYNSDGSLAQMCGNAARCAARFFFDHIDSSKKSIRFETVAGVIGATILDDLVEVQMPAIALYNQHLELRQRDGSFISFVHLNTGVPHLVLRRENLDFIHLQKDFAKEMRSHSGLPSEGANVTFFSQEGGASIKAVTFERGVEGFTEACGTGAVAAAYASHLDHGYTEIEVQMPGGLLTVKFPEGGAPLMTGPAIYTAKFSLNLEMLK